LGEAGVSGTVPKEDPEKHLLRTDSSKTAGEQRRKQNIYFFPEACSTYTLSLIRLGQR